MVKGGLKAIYLSGWQVAADANLSEQVYPDQSLYAANSVPAVVRRINNALRRADAVHWAEGDASIDWFVPIVADAEAGFGGALNAFELMKGMIEAGASAVHFEDQLASEKKCGHLGGKVLVPTKQFIQTLTAARLAAGHGAQRVHVVAAAAVHQVPEAVGAFAGECVLDVARSAQPDDVGCAVGALDATPAVLAPLLLERGDLLVESRLRGGLFEMNRAVARHGRPFLVVARGPGISRCVGRREA
jgi:hypothetical protein